MQLRTSTALGTWRDGRTAWSSVHCQCRQRRCSIQANAAAIAVVSGSQAQHYQRDVLRKMLKFMGPAVLIPMADPLMAVVDTIFVGQFAGTSELAAMGPANSLFAFALYIFRSLQVSTQSLVASELRSGNKPEAAQLLGTGLSLAAVLGVVGGCLLGFNSEALVLATGVKDQALASQSAGYLSVRALALPAVILTAVAQSGKLAQHDSVTPCLSVMLSVAFSFIANVVVVAGLGWGLVGAAITTVATQYLGAVALLVASHHPLSQLKPDWRIPRSDQMWTFLTTMAPLTTTFVSKNTCYLLLQSAAATLATLSLAAHQAAFSLWTLFTWAMSPVEQACLAYLPAATHPWQQRATTQLIMGLGVGVSLMTGGVLATLLLFSPGLLVKDVAVHALMSSVAPQATLSIILIGIDMAATSINIALRDYGYVARSYLITLTATAAYYFLGDRSHGWGLPGVWWGLCMFFGLRFVQSVGRTLTLMDWWPRLDVGSALEMLMAPVPVLATAGTSLSVMSQQQMTQQRNAASMAVAAVEAVREKVQTVLPVLQLQATTQALISPPSRFVHRPVNSSQGSAVVSAGNHEDADDGERLGEAGLGVPRTAVVDTVTAGANVSNVVPFTQIASGAGSGSGAVGRQTEAASAR